MSIEVPVLEVFGLADRLRATSEHGTTAAARLQVSCLVGELAGPLDRLAEGARLAAGALGVESALLGEAADCAARSWLALDTALLDRRGQVLAR